MVKQDFVALKKVVLKTTTSSVRRQLLLLRDGLLHANAQARAMLGHSGSLPGFIIIGAQKCGTTHLYDELSKHPFVAPALTKEVHFFDSNFDKGIKWYQTFFPDLTRAQSDSCEYVITGEASPSYLFHPHAARHVYQILPETKLIVILRDPVARAYSHYQHEVRLGYETLSFADAIERENTQLQAERKRMVEDRSYYSHDYMHFSYLSRGIYVDQIQAWHREFRKAQVLILKAEHFFQDTPRMVAKVADFLGLPRWKYESRREPKAFPYPQLDEDIKRYLVGYFRPHNARLYDYLETDFGWER